MKVFLLFLVFCLVLMTGCDGDFLFKVSEQSGGVPITSLSPNDSRHGRYRIVYYGSNLIEANGTAGEAYRKLQDLRFADNTRWPDVQLFWFDEPGGTELRVNRENAPRVSREIQQAVQPLATQWRIRNSLWISEERLPGFGNLGVRFSDDRPPVIGSMRRNDTAPALQSPFPRRMTVFPQSRSVDMDFGDSGKLNIYVSQDGRRLAGFLILRGQTYPVHLSKVW